MGKFLEFLESGLKSADSGLGDRSTYVGASDVGQCLKKAYLSKKVGEDHSFKQLMVFERGHVAEGIVQKALNAKGVHYSAQERIRLTGEHSFMEVGPDFLVHFDSECVVLECKSISSPLPDGRSRESWVFQTQLQMEAVRQKYDCFVRGIIFAVNLNTGETEDFPVEPNEALLGVAFDRAQKLWTALQADEEPEGEMSDLCGFCSFKGQCSTLKNNAAILPTEIVQMAQKAKELSKAEKEAKSIKDNIKAFFEAAGIKKGTANGVTMTLSVYGKDIAVANNLKVENFELYSKYAERVEGITALRIY
jgi:CRISPR-associated exonuclease Cas4